MLFLKEECRGWRGGGEGEGKETKTIVNKNYFYWNEDEINANDRFIDGRRKLWKNDGA